MTRRHLEPGPASAAEVGPRVDRASAVGAGLGQRCSAVRAELLASTALGAAVAADHKAPLVPTHDHGSLAD
jgi:hypothetical protein